MAKKAAAPEAAETSSEDNKQRKNPTVKKTARAVLEIYDIVTAKNDATLRDIKPKKSEAKLEKGLSDEELLARAKQLVAADEAVSKYDGLSDNQLRSMLKIVKEHLGIAESTES